MEKKSRSLKRDNRVQAGTKGEKDHIFNTISPQSQLYRRAFGFCLWLYSLWLLLAHKPKI